MPLYFAYGSSVNESDLKETIAQPLEPIKAKLLDHRVDFTLNTLKRDGGVADIIYSPGDHVWGVLWTIPNFYSLDVRHGHPYVYERREIAVETEFGTRAVFTYSVAHKENPVRPSAAYLSCFQTPAIEINQDYIDTVVSYAKSLPQPPEPTPLWRALVFKEDEVWGESFHNVSEAVESIESYRKLGFQTQLIHSGSGKFYDTECD